MVNQQLLNGSPEVMMILFVLSIAVSLIAVLVALDSQDRGKSKTHSILWFFAIQLFAPAALVYLAVRNRGKAQARNAKAIETFNCPYCNAPYHEGDRMCSQCGRIL